MSTHNVAKFPMWNLPVDTAAGSGEDMDLLAELARTTIEEQFDPIKDMVEPLINEAIKEKENESQHLLAHAAFRHTAGDFQGALHIKSRIKPDEVGREIFDNFFGIVHFGAAYQLQRTAQVDTGDGKTQMRVLRNAIDQLEIALQHSPELIVVLLFAAKMSLTLAKLAKSSGTSRRYIAGMNAYMVRYTRVCPEDDKGWFLWGSCLRMWCDRLEDSKRRPFLIQAADKLSVAVKINGDNPEAFNLLSAVTLEQIELSTEIEHRTLLNQAEWYASETEQIKAGSGAYDLACVCARKHDISACREWLRKAVAHRNPPDPSQYLNDDNLATVRDTPWFRTLVAGLPQP